MATETKLKTNEQDVPMFEYNAAVHELIKISKAKKEEIDHHIVLATNNLKQLQEEHIKRQGEFSQWKMGEEQKFRNELSKKHNQIVDQENRMNILHRDLEQRRADLLVKEERYMKIQEERNEIGEARIEVQKLKVAATQLMDEANRTMSEAHSIMAQSNTRADIASRLDEKNITRNQELVAREDKLIFDLKNIEIERKHLTELKEFVEPKIKEIKEIEDNILKARKEIDITQQDIINKNEENKIAIKALEDKKVKLDIQDRELRSREDEFKRKVLISEAKK